MEWYFNVEQIDDTKIKILDDFNLSPWNYSVKVGSKWHNIFIDSPILVFNRSIQYWFDEIKNQPIKYGENNEQLTPNPKILITLDLIEYKKLQKIDNIKIGGGIITPTMPPSEDVEILKNQLNLKQKQIVILNSRLDNLENLLKKSLGLL
jgi:hypothetical protein